MAKQTPARVEIPIIVGVSTAIYAASLAGVAGLQASQDQAARDAIAGLTSSVADARAARESIEVELRLAGAAFNRSVDGYDDVRSRAELLSAEIQELAAAVEAVSGDAAALPSNVVFRAPAQRIVRIIASAPAPAPAVQATTGASG